MEVLASVRSHESDQEVEQDSLRLNKSIMGIEDRMKRMKAFTDQQLGSQVEDENQSENKNGSQVTSLERVCLMRDRLLSDSRRSRAKQHTWSQVM